MTETSLLDSGTAGLLGALIGGASSFLAQRWFFKEQLKKQIREEIYYPLLDELDNTKDRVMNFYRIASAHKWDAIYDSSKYRYIPDELREKLLQFFKQQTGDYDLFRNNAHKVAGNCIGTEFTGLFGQPELNLRHEIRSEYFTDTVLRFNSDEKIYEGNWDRMTFDWGYTGTLQDFIQNVANKMKNDQSMLDLRDKRSKILVTIQELKLSIGDLLK